MTFSQIIIRTSKSTQLHNKNGKYEILLNNEIQAELDSINHKQFFTVESGKNIVQIKNENTIIEKEVILKNGQIITFTINVSVTYKMGLGFMIGIALAGFIIQFFIAKKLILPLNFIPFISLLLFKKDSFPNSFEVTCRK
ncbi:hypothetical protein V7S79_01940 [Aquirufa sp. ROCK-SH2]